MLERLFADRLPVRFEQFADVPDKSWTSPHHQLLWTQQRDFACEIGERASGVPRQGLLLVKPGHAIRIVSANLAFVRCRCFYAPFLQPALAANPAVVLGSTQHGKRLLSLILSFRSRSLDAGAVVRLSTLLIALLSECLLHAEENGASVPTPVAASKTVQRKKSGLPIVYAVRFMRKHLSNPDLSLNEIASSVGYNANYFCQEFSQIFGVSPIRHLNELRVEQALRDLEQTDEQVQAICRNVGIRNPGHLTAMIKNKVGMTPMAYRRSRRREQ